MMRYLKHLENKDLSLTHAMIPLGIVHDEAQRGDATCFPSAGRLSPSSTRSARPAQAAGTREMVRDLEQYLCEITGFSGMSLQPNSGAQGEYTGLLVIRAYHAARGEAHRNICLIPSSAHGTNPASAVMCGMKVVVVGCDKHGNINLDELKEKAAEHADNLGALMITYPSTHGVFEDHILEVTQTVHEHGGQIYMDGANMNAQVGLTSPGRIGADVCHLNLHKTFAIPHGGGGPGVGPWSGGTPRAVLAGSPARRGGDQAIDPVSAAPFGSALIHLISYAYIRLLGPEGLKRSTEVAILNANYLRARLEGHYDVLFKGNAGNVAHEMIIDCRPFKQSAGIEVTDIAKRLIDYGFHAPTVSWPVAGTLMIEPTESESLDELDRFCEAMIAIREEIRAIEKKAGSTARTTPSACRRTLRRSLRHRVAPCVHPGGGGLSRPGDARAQVLAVRGAGRQCAWRPEFGVHLPQHGTLHRARRRLSGSDSVGRGWGAIFAVTNPTPTQYEAPLHHGLRDAHRELRFCTGTGP